MDDILKKYPPSSQNNARQILREKMERFKKSPSESRAQELESFGITVDFSDADHGIEKWRV
jgi:hypothetical protein